MLKKFLATAIVLGSLGSACNGEAPKREKRNIEKKTEQFAEDSPAIEVVGDVKGKVTIKGTVGQRPAIGKVYLWETEGRLKHLIDSVKITGDNRFAFPEREYGIGLYKIGFDKVNNFTDIIINPKEGNVLDITIPAAFIKNGITFPGSKDNQVWAEYSKKKGEIDGVINQLRNEKRTTGREVKADIDAKMRELTALQKKMATENPGTFSSKVLSRFSSPKINDKATYWDDVDFKDLSYIRSEAINERIQEFMRTHSDGKDQGYFECIDILTKKAEVNSVMLEFALYTMLDGFYQSNMEHICAYMLDQIIYGDGCGTELSDFMLQRAQGIQNLRVGNIPPDFTIETDKGGKLTLSKEVKANKYTLVMFWSSWCQKCEQEIPALLPVYAQYKPKGFQVIGVNMDNNKPAWIEAVAKKGITFPTVSQYRGWDSPVIKDYRITSSPALILLDKDMRIVSKPERIFEVKNFLDQNLK
jgi:thiol-disulfide isomerase/thioredoxin